MYIKKKFTPSSRGVEKYVASVSSDLTNAHSTIPSSPERASRTDLTKRFPAKAIDRVAEPLTIKQAQLYNSPINYMLNIHGLIRINKGMPRVSSTEHQAASNGCNLTRSPQPGR